MQLHPWDPDIETLIGRITSGDLNLQPDFQRGEVWGAAKRRRLIDTILRGWHVPPVHVVVEQETEQHEVLDGQQRLAAIRDFAKGEISVDGKFPPYDREIAELDGLTYAELPDRMRRRFDNYTLRVIRITDYRPEEPGELFFRLNQPTGLTSAEQRNAYYGAARVQVKDLVHSLDALGITAETVGFTNSRMAYDDIVAKVCFAHHVGTLREKITAGVVTSLYRSGEPFSEEAVRRTRAALQLFGDASRLHRDMKYNKATLFSWLLFLSALRQQARAAVAAPAVVSEYMVSFEKARLTARGLDGLGNLEGLFPVVPAENQHQILLMYGDRSTSRVADVSSVVSRDAVLWLFFNLFCVRNDSPLELPDESRALLDEATFAVSTPRANAAGIFENMMSDLWGRRL